MTQAERICVNNRLIRHGPVYGASDDFLDRIYTNGPAEYTTWRRSYRYEPGVTEDLLAAIDDAFVVAARFTQLANEIPWLSY